MVVVQGDAIIFGSDPKLYELEKSGKKPNTVRALDLLGKAHVLNTPPKMIIVFIRGVEGKEFTRDLTDISFVDAYELADGRELCVFSWNPGGDSQ
jgi:hypothetical protein